MSSSSSQTIERLHALERVLTLVVASDQPEQPTEHWTYLASAYYYLAEIKRSYEVALRWVTWCEDSRQSTQLRMAYAWMAWIHASQGSLAEAEQALERALVSRTTSPQGNLSDLLYSIRGLLAAQQEQYDVAEQAFQALLAHPHARADNAISCAPLLSLIYLGAEKRDEARLAMGTWQDYLAKLPPGTLPTLPIMLALAVMLISLSEQEQALEVYHNLQPFQGYHCWFLADRVLGELAAYAGDANAAEIHFVRAEAIARREGLLPELARTLLGRANLETSRSKRGHTPQAEAHLKEALALFGKLSMHKSAHDLRSRLGQLPPQPDKPKTSTLPADLTQREVEILRLVAAGKSNHQIARTLNLSDKTVANHLTTIFHKTASENRAAAAAFAIRHGLV
jgi:DNA-binding CsgD family transcriptional regulator